MDDCANYLGSCPVNSEKVQEVKSNINSGAYRFDADSIACELIKETKYLFSDTGESL